MTKIAYVVPTDDDNLTIAQVKELGGYILKDTPKDLTELEVKELVDKLNNDNSYSELGRYVAVIN